MGVEEILLPAHQQPIFPKTCVWCGKPCPKSGVGLHYFFRGGLSLFSTKSGRILVRVHPACCSFLKLSYYSRKLVFFFTAILFLILLSYLGIPVSRHAFFAPLLIIFVWGSFAFFIDSLIPSPFYFAADSSGLHFRFKFKELAEEFKLLNTPSESANQEVKT